MATFPRKIRALLLVASLAVAGAAGPVTLARRHELRQRPATGGRPFLQEKHLAIFPEPVVSKGAIELSRPMAAIRWEFSGRSLIILKDGRIRRWDDQGHEQVGDDPSLEAL